jgi:hypothetical protein
MTELVLDFKNKKRLRKKPSLLQHISFKEEMMCHGRPLALVGALNAFFF